MRACLLHLLACLLRDRQEDATQRSVAESTHSESLPLCNVRRCVFCQYVVGIRPLASARKTITGTLFLLLDQRSQNVNVECLNQVCGTCICVVYVYVCMCIHICI